MTDFREFKKEALKNKEVKKHYKASHHRYQNIRRWVKRQVKHMHRICGRQEYFD